MQLYTYKNYKAMTPKDKAEELVEEFYKWVAIPDK